MIAIVGSIEPPKATTPVHQRMTESLIAEIRPSISRGVHRAFQQLGEDADFCQAVTDEALSQVARCTDHFDGRSKFVTWAMAIAIRVGSSRRHAKLLARQAQSPNE